LKALPSSYNRDLQEDKEALFDSTDTVGAALDVFSAMLPKMKINRDRMKAAAGDPNLLATDLVEYLVKKGIPFREAHEIVGDIVARAAKRGADLNEIAFSELKKIFKKVDIDLGAEASAKAAAAKVFNARRSLSARTAIGAPSPKNVKAQIKSWRGRLR
jgi:argininosuccinate lyase